MTALEDALDRPEFETIDLDVGVEAAHDGIVESIKGLRTSESTEGRKYRTADGMLVAIVGRRPSGSGDVEAKLAYRTAPAADLATRKARKVYEALEGHAIHG